MVKRFTILAQDDPEVDVPQRSRPTIIDVARIAGVSPTTVSYVLSGPKERADRISEDTRTRVLAAVENVGYVPNLSARMLRLRRTNRILFLGNRMNSLFSQARAKSIDQALAPHAFELSVQIGSGLDHLQRAITTLDQNQADGLILETDDSFLPELRAAAASGHAIVAFGPSAPEATFDVLSHDYAPAIQDAVRHLIERNNRHFVLLSRLPNTLEDHRVRTAFQHLRSMGVSESDITILHCPHDQTEAHVAALQFLPRLPRPTAVFAGSDVSAIGVVWACLKLGLRIPNDAAIIGHGNSPETMITVPQLTSLGPIRNDFAKAADLMVSRLRNRSQPGRHVSEPCKLSIRESS